MEDLLEGSEQEVGLAPAEGEGRKEPEDL